MWIEDYSGKISQGTIVDGIPWKDGEDQPLGIVLSNACDLEHNHSSFIIVAALVSAKDVLTRTNDFKNKLQDHKINQKNAQKFFKPYINNESIVRYYFTGDYIEAGIDDYLMVDFQQIQSFDISSIESLEPLAQLRHPFIEQMMMRYTAYTSRIPSDRVSEEEFQKMVNYLAEDFLA